MTPEPDNEVAQTTCSSCGEGLNEGQDWCLTCGTAAPGRLRRRPGGRAALTTVALTLALTTGAVAASYAALSTAPIKKGDVKYPVVASQQVPAQTTETPPAKSKPAPKKKSSAKPKTEAVAVTPPAAPAAPTSPTKNAETEDKPAEPSAITIPEGGGAAYDPLVRALFSEDDPYDPAAAFDDDKESSWAITSNGEGDLQLGYVIDLKKAREVRRLDLLTDTPGFRAEILGAKADELPPQISDSRWEQLKVRDNVDGTSKEDGKPGDGQERITLPDRNQNYRYVLIWFTKPAPTVAPDPPSRTVRLFDLKLFG